MISTSFLIAIAAFFTFSVSAATPTPVVAAASTVPSSAYWPYQSFHSSSFRPPQLNITTSGADLAPGYILFTVGSANASSTINGGAKEVSPLIMTDTGDLVWNGPKNTSASNLQAITFQGEPALAYWSGVGNLAQAHFYGSVHVLNASYDEIYTLCPDYDIILPSNIGAGECHVDMHDFFFTDNGTVVFTMYNITNWDLSSIDGPVDGYAYDAMVYEIDVTTGEILFNWHALQHVPVNETRSSIGAGGISGNQSSPFDYFHINSVQKVGGDYLINGRYTWSTYLVNPDGNVEWTISGDTGGDFGALPTGADFRWQHHVRVSNVTDDSMVMSMFNNNDFIYHNTTSNALVFSLNTGSDKSVELLDVYQNENDPKYAYAQGSTAMQDNGNALVFYGYTPVAEEFGPDGDLRWRAQFGNINDVQSYRMFKQDWVGAPSTKPSLKTKNHHNITKGWTSWNGATEVTQWTVYAGACKDSLAQVDVVQKTGFETAFEVAQRGICVQVAAMNGDEWLRNSTIRCKN